jgi:hypothetical protein
MDSYLNTQQFKSLKGINVNRKMLIASLLTVIRGVDRGYWILVAGYWMLDAGGTMGVRPEV